MVISQVDQNVYNGDGITKAWPYTFDIIDATDVHVILQEVDGTQTVLTSDYYVDTVNSTVYYPGYAPGAEPPEASQPPVVAEGQKIIVYRDLPLTQEADLGEKWPFFVIEKGLDKLTMLLQDMWGWGERNFLQLLPGATSWDAQQRPISNAGDPTDMQDLTTKNYVDSIIAGIVAEGNDVIVVDNISVLRATDLAAGMFVGVGGLNEVGDGGSGSYYIRTAQLSDVDDGYDTIILDNGNVAVRFSNYDACDRSILNCEFVRNEGFKDYYKYSDSPSAVYGSYQGFSETSYGTFVGMMIPVEYLYNYESGYITDKAVIVEYDSDMQVVRKSNPITLYHGGALSFYGGKIYVTARSSGSTAINKIVVVDYATLTVESEIDVSDYGASFVWFKDSYMYTGTRSHIEQREMDGTLIEHKVLTGLPAFHSMKPYKGMYLATLNAPNTLCLLDSDYKIVKNYSFHGIYNRGEVKDIAVVGDDLYIPYNDRSYTRGANYELSEVYAGIIHVNLLTNVVQNNYKNISYGNEPSCYVDPTTTSTVQTGSSENPYATIMQGIRAGYKFIRLSNCSGGLFLFGDNDAYISGSASTDMVFLGKVENCKLVLNNITVGQKTVLNSMSYVDIVLTNSVTVSTTLNTSYCSINAGAATINPNDSGYTKTFLPASSPSNGFQNYTILDSTDGNIPVDFGTFQAGAYIINLRLVASGVTFSVNMSSPIQTLINQYFVTCARSGASNAMLTGYLTLTITGGKIVPAVTYCELNGSAVTPTITRLVVTHI